MSIIAPSIKRLKEEEGKSENLPISEKITDYIFDKASDNRALKVFGPSSNVYAIGTETLLPSYQKADADISDFRVLVGGPQCCQPYSASIYNSSALSFGPLSKNFILALNKAAHKQQFFQNTGEAGLSPFHFGLNVDIEDNRFNFEELIEQVVNSKELALQHVGDIVWEIGSGYFSCRLPSGRFDYKKFGLISQLDNLKMIEVKLSQGVEPSKALPVKELTPGLAKILGVSFDENVALPQMHPEFSTPIELLGFIKTLRELSDGKPIGLKLSLGHKHEFLSICKAMLKTGILLDFITVDGMEGGTTGSTPSVLGFTGSALDDALVFVDNALRGSGLRHQIKVIVSGRIFSEKDIISKCARGADICSAARAILIAAGCDQQLECYKGTCSKGIATQDPLLMERLNVRETAEKIINFHKYTLSELAELLSITGVSHPSELSLRHLEIRTSLTQTQALDEMYSLIKPNAFLTWLPWQFPKAFLKYWQRADAFKPFNYLNALNKKVD